MAAIAIPIATEVLPVVAPFVVKLVEKLFGKGNGPTVKLPTATDITTAVYNALAPVLQAKGVALPTADQVKSLVQEAVDVLNKNGELQGHDTVVSTSVPAAPATPAVPAVAGVSAPLKAVTNTPNMSAALDLLKVVETLLGAQAS